MKWEKEMREIACFSKLLIATVVFIDVLGCSCRLFEGYGGWRRKRVKKKYRGEEYME